MAKGWQIANGLKIMANFNCTVKDIWNMFILDGGKTHYADLPRQVHIKKKTYTPCNIQWEQSYLPLFLIWLFITMFSLRLRFLEKTLFTFRLIHEKQKSRLWSYVTTSSCPVASPLLPFGITKVILHCRELSICNYHIGGWLKSHERTISYIFPKRLSGCHPSGLRFVATSKPKLHLIEDVWRYINDAAIARRKCI